MRKLFLMIITTLALIAPVSAMASSTDKDDNAAKAKVTALVEKYSKRDGFESTKFGSVATSAMRSMMKLGAKSQDPKSKKTMKVFDGVKSFVILQYEDCSSSSLAVFEREFRSAVSGYDVLFEAKDGGDKTTVYALINEKKSVVTQFILQAEKTLIIMDGSIDLKTLVEATQQIK